MFLCVRLSAISSVSVVWVYVLVLHSFNLIFYGDDDNKVMILHPQNDCYVAGAGSKIFWFGVHVVIVISS